MIGKAKRGRFSATVLMMLSVALPVALSAGPAEATPVLDQSFTTPTNLGAGLNQGCKYVAQTFTAGVTGTLIAAVVVVVMMAAFVIAVVIGFRRRAAWALDVMRWMTKIVFNPVEMKRAGRPGAYAGVIEHRGRVTDRAYRTPVGIRPTDDGFVIALPYDRRPDWIKNVLAAGSARLVYEGQTSEVDRPQVLPIGWAMPFFTEREQRRMGSITRCLRLRTVATS
jgi:deazaflavin-dependent oxidoreductase (nitroreductase family)